jgi:hypothetical protein
MIPLRSYGQPPNEDVFNGLDYFDLRLNNVCFYFILFYYSKLS